MQCPNCGHSNTPEASFCSNCGHALPITCPSCATSVEAGSRFCPTCGYQLVTEVNDGSTDLNRYLPEGLLAKIQAARSGRTMAGERRTVTMLFADVQGSTAAAEQLDPEDWVEIMNGAFERLILPVYRYEGTLAQLQGDAILAFFGAPIAHEDDPERAVMAGLEMMHTISPYSSKVKKEWGIPIQIRIGINTGLVVVGEVGSDLRVEYTALGDAVNIAARMEQTAEPGTIQISESTHRLAGPMFELTELGPTTVKGKKEPIPTYRVIGQRSRPQSTRGPRNTTSAVVGRVGEMDELHRLVESLTEGRGSICTLVGEAGLGKSRLISQLKSDLDERGLIGPWWSSDDSSRVGWGLGKAVSYNTVVPYWPIVDLLNNCLDLHSEDTNAVKHAKLVEAVEHLAPDARDDFVPYLMALLGIDAGPEVDELVAGLQSPQLQRRTFSAVVGLIEAAAGDHPIALVFEDLHWADPVSLALLEELMGVTDRTMLMLMAVMRPYRDDPSWRFHEVAARDYDHRYTSLTLNPLDAVATRELVLNLLGEGVSPETRAEIISKSEGNPFFVEEMFNSLIDSGSLVDHDGGWRTVGASNSIDVSPTITGLMTARLDRLDDGSKFVAQLASVIGREFRIDELEQLTDESIDLHKALADLLRRSLLEERSRLPERVYAFRHALLQETAYQSVLRRSRKELHGRIASYLEASHPDDVQEIATHLTRAGEGRRALPYLVEAGDRASRAMSLADAIKFYDQALATTEDEDFDLMRRAHEGLGVAYTLIPDLTHAASAYQEMLEFGRLRAEPSVQVTALNRLGYAAGALGGDFEQATEYLEDARQLAEKHDDELGLAEYHIYSCMIATGRGDMEKAAAHDAETARMGEAAGSPQLRMRGLVQRAISLANAARFEEGELALDEAVRAAEETGDEVIRAGVAAAASPYYLLREGRLEEAAESTRWAFEVTKRFGSSWAGRAAVIAGYIAALRGAYEEALALEAEGARLGEELEQSFVVAAAAAHTASIYAEVGDEDGAAEWSVRAKSLMERPMATILASTVWGRLGWAELSLGRPKSALDHFETGLTVSSATRYLERPWSLIGAGEALMAMGELAEARSKISEAEIYVRESELTQVRPRLAFAFGRLSVEVGDLDSAVETLSNAALDAEAMGMEPLRWQIHSVTAQTLSSLGRFGESELETAKADEIIAGIAGNIVDEELREGFLQMAARHVSAATET